MLYFFILHFTDKKEQSRVFETGSVGLVETHFFFFFFFFFFAFFYVLYKSFKVKDN